MGYNFSDKVSGDWEAGLDKVALLLKSDVAHAGAQAMAQVVYDAAKENAPVADKPHKLKGGRYSVPGALKGSIYQVYSKRKSVRSRVEFHVSWNRIKAPHGHLVEFGTSRAPAHPFLYPAYSENKMLLPVVANAAMMKKVAEFK